MEEKPTVLFIAGHGLRKNRTFDPGASGLVTEGEWRYFSETSFFDHMKKYIPEGADVVFHTAYNVYSYGDIVNLAKKFGNNTIVIEFHFDASSTSNAHRGHVIVYGGFIPDEFDLRLRDAIKDTLGVRYTHKGYEGVSGRYNLANVNRTAKGGVNYRLLELGFGTSHRDSKVMNNEIDDYAKAIVEAVFDTEVKVAENKDSMAGYHVVESGDTLWAIAQEYGVKVTELKKWNDLDNNVIFPGQSLEVIGSDTPAPPKESESKQTPPANTSNSIKVGSWVRVPANKLYETGNSSSPTNSRELSAKVDKVNNNWKNPIRLIKNGVYQGFVRSGDIKGGGQKETKRYIGKRVESIHSGNLRFYSKPSWSDKDVAGTITKGYGFPTIVDRVNVGGAQQYKVKNSKGATYYITASPSYVTVV